MANEFEDLIPKVKPQNEFADLIPGIAPPRPETQMAFRAIPEKSLFTEGKELVLDTAIGLGQGLTGLVKGITDNYKAGDNPLSNFLGDVIAFGDKHISNDLRGARAERQYMIDRAARIGNEGAATRVATKTIFDNPIAGIDVAAKGTDSVVPLVAAGLAGVGPGILGLIGALSNGGDAASQAAEQLKAMPEEAWMQLPEYRTSIEQGMTPVDAKRKMAPGLAIPAQVVGLATGMMPGRLEKIVTKPAKQVGLNAALRRVGAELAGEQLQSIAPQVAANATARHYDGTTALNKGLGQAVVDTFIGSAPGAALSARHTPPPQQQPAQPADAAAPDNAALTDLISSTVVIENRQPQAVQAQIGQDNEFADLIPQRPQTDQDFVSRAESAPSAQANASPVASPLPGSQAGPAVPDQAAVVPAAGQAAEVLPRPQEGTANQGNIQPAPLQAEQTGSTMPRQVLAETAPAPSQPQEMAPQIARPDGVNIAQEAPEQAAAVLQTVPQERQMPVPAVISERAMQIESPTPGLRPGDIVAADGKPFPNKSAAGPAAKNAGKGWCVVKGGGGFVVRHQPQSDTQIANTKRLQKQQNQVDTDSDSLFAAIAKLGGIRTDQLTKEWGFDPKEIRTIRGAGIKRIATKNGMSLDRMGEALAELGYLSYDEHGKHDLSELFDLFDGELRGSKHYTPQGYERAYREAEAARIEELSQADIEASGLDDLSDDAHDAIEELLDDYPTIDQEEDARISVLIEAAWDQPVSGMGGEAQQTAGRAAERGDGSAAEANQEAPPESGADQRAADSVGSTQEVKPPFGDVPFSRSGEANTSALEQLAQEDELFQLPKSDKTTVEGITADNDPNIKVRKLTNIPGGTHYEFTMPNGLKAWMSDRPYNPYGTSIYGYDLEDGERTEEVAERPGRNAEAVEGKDDVWINVSLLNKGSGYGAKIYNIGATYAHNNGKVFIGDPAGLSDVAMRRWPEQMLSSALKFGTTEHLAPHPRQIKGDKNLGIPRLDWVYGDHLGNIRKLIELNEKNIDNAGGNGGIVYNKKTGQFEDADGNSLTRADLDGMAKVGLGRAAGAGGSTLARHALFKSLVQGESGQVRGPDGILVSLRGQVRQHGAAGSGSALRDIFYSKQRANRPALTVEAVHQAIAADTFNHDVDVYPTLADAPAYVREQVEREGATDVEGFWNTRTNRIALIAENLSSAERAREVARHELIGHYGLENMVGSAEMDRLAQRVIQSEKDGNKTIAQLARQVDATQPGLDGTRRAKEIIAVMAERNIQNSITQRIYDAIRKFLKKIGFIKSDITDAKIAGLLRDAQAYLQEQGRASIAGEPALAFSRVEPTDNPAQTMRELAKQAQEEGNGNRTIELGEVAKWEAEAARDAGLAIDGYRHTADVYAIRHALKNHGKAPVEAKRGQLAITEDDIAAIPDVILQPDSIILGVQNARKQELVFSVKNMPDGTLLVTEEVRIGRKTLALVSVRKVPGAKNAKALLPSVLPNVRSDTGNNPIIVDAPTGLNPASFSRTRAPKDPQADLGLNEPMQGPIRARDFVSFRLIATYPAIAVSASLIPNPLYKVMVDKDEAASGDPMAYWNRLSSSCATMIPRSWIARFGVPYTPAGLYEVREKLKQEQEQEKRLNPHRRPVSDCSRHFPPRRRCLCDAGRRTNAHPRTGAYRGRHRCRRLLGSAHQPRRADRRQSRIAAKSGRSRAP